MRQLLIGLCVVSLLVVSVFAYGGTRVREASLYDPYSRSKYFGEGYQKPLIGYGEKNAPQNSFGRKGFNGGREKFTVSLIRQGRNPGRVSHVDSGYRGYRMMDEIVKLKPTESYSRENLATAPPQVTARVVYLGRSATSDLPKSQVLIRAIGLPLLRDYEAYELWLSDEESGYALSLGYLMSNYRSGVAVNKIGVDGGLGGELSTGGSYDVSLYDNIIVTRERFPDSDPRPSGDIIVIGDIPQRLKNE